MQILHLQLALADPIHHPPLQSSDSIRNTQKTPAGLSIEMLTDTQGVDFEPFMQSVYRPVRRECFAGMPHSIEKGEKGIVSIEFRVQQDGKVPADSLKILSSSGKKELDDASLNAIHNDLFHLPSSAPKARLSYAAANVLASTCLTANAVARTWERDLTTFVSTNVRNVVNATFDLPYVAT